MRTSTLPSRLLKGPALLGFALNFDSVHGDETTPFPYLVVIPSAVGPALLPFRCPHCQAVCSELVHPDKRLEYYDKLRKFSWCPKCRKRFFVDRKGKQLGAALPAGADVAPSEVEAGDKSLTVSDVKLLPGPISEAEACGFDMLGAFSSC